MKAFRDEFDAFNVGNWYVSNFALATSWVQNGWSDAYVDTGTAGELTLLFDGADYEDKPFTGAEIQSNAFYSYGTYEVEMIASDVSGVVSSFFLFTSEFFGADQHNEIDIEFLGDDTTVVNINYYYDDGKLGADGSIQIPLGFDAAEAMHTYTIAWLPDSIRWYADGTMLFEVTADTASVPIPDEDMKIYASIWTGGDVLAHWAGPIEDDATAQASYSSVSYDPFVAIAAPASAGAVSFAGQTEGLEIDLAAGTYSRAVRVMPIGDSLTLGAVNTELNEVNALREGYRYDLFERILASGGWIDYVGGLQNGPDGFLDKDHQGIGGKHLDAIVDDSDGTSDLSDALARYLPDIVLFMAGTNDYYNNGDAYFFSNYFPEIIGNTVKAIDQFYAYAGSEEKYLVVSTLPPKAKGGVSPEHSAFLNQGYSIVGGTYVLGDAGNGTYVPGIKATVENLKATHPTLIAFENPVVDMSQMSFDLLHILDVGYSQYAEALFQTLEAEIGLTTSGFSSLQDTLPAADDVTGSEAGDRIGGNGNANYIDGGAGNDFLEGRAGADTLEGGSGQDVFAYGLDALDGTTDTIVDYSVSDGDIVSLGAIADGFGWSDAEIAANIRVIDTVDGAEIWVHALGGDHLVARVLGVDAADVTIATTQITQVFAQAEVLYGNENDNTLYDVQYSRAIYGLGGRDTIYGQDGNDTLVGGTGADRLYGGLGADRFIISGEDLDGSQDQIRDFSIAEGDKLDLSGIADFYGWTADELLSRLVFRDTNTGDMRITVNLPTSSYTFLYVYSMNKATLLASTALVLESAPPPDTGDDDGNLALSLPDTVIDASEVSAVVVTLAGLDADATAVVTLNANGTQISQSTGSNGNLIFDLSGLPDGTVTTSVTATDGGGNSTTVAGPSLTLDTVPDTSADEDGNLAVTAPDTSISASEAAAVILTLVGLDADATAVITVSDGTNAVSSGVLSANGNVTLNLSSLADGALSVSVTATDTSGNVATVSGPALTLDTVTDDTADADGNLAVTAPDTAITLGEETAVAFTLAGLDADATAVIRVSDGTTTVSSAVLSANGTVMLNLSLLADGALTVTVTATDTTGNVAAATGPAMTLDTSEPSSDPEPTITGTPASDTIDGTSGDDVIAGLAGNDTVKGKTGNDYLLGGDGNDWLRGDDGNDTIDGGTGSDTLIGSAGADLFLLKAGDLDGSADEIKDFSISDGDVIELRDFLPLGASLTNVALYLRILKSGTIGLVQYDPSGTGTNYVDFAKIRNGSTFTIQGMIDDGLLLISNSDASQNGQDDSATTEAGVSIALEVLANDFGGAPGSSLSIAGGPSHGTATVIDGEVIYTPTGGYIGTDTFTYASSSGEALVTIDVLAAAAQTTELPEQIHLAWTEDSSTTLTVVWRLDVGVTASEVQYRIAGTGSWTADQSALRASGTVGGDLYEATLEGLTPGTEYEFRVRLDDGSWSTILDAETAPLAGTADFDVVFFADTGLIGRTDGLTGGAEQAIAEIAALDPLLLLGGGDYAYYNTDTRYGTLDASIDAWFDDWADVLAQSPLLTAYGNHELYLGEGFSNWNARLPQPDENQLNSGLFYSYDVAGAHFIVIDLARDNDTLSNDELAWLEADIAAAQAAGATWIVPYMHASLFSGGMNHGDLFAARDQLGPLFEAYGIDLVLSAHDQSYLRTYPIENISSVESASTNVAASASTSTYYAESDGVIWMKVSPAGKLSSENGDFSQWVDETAPDYVAVRDNTLYHYAHLTFGADGTLSVEVLGYDGTGAAPVVIDSFQILPGAANTGDDDGNLALSVPDTAIDASEVTAVVVTLIGLDSDATAVITVNDGSNAVTSGVLTADGDVTLNLSGLADGVLTLSVTATDGSGNSTTVAGPSLTLDTVPDTTADEDGDLAVTAPDTTITASEAAAVILTLAGLDADATAVITVSDGTNAVTSAVLSANGDVTLNLSALDDGALTVSVTATDTAGNIATVSGPAMTLDTLTDDSADADGNLAVTAPDTAITLGEETAVDFTLSGLDADATAVITVSDGSNAVASAALAANGTVTLNLSTLADGTLTVSVTATDTTGNVATATGPAMTLDTSEPSSDPEPTISGTAANNTIDGTAGDDVIAGLAGNDTIKGKAGNDWLLGGDGNDWLRGDDGNDTIHGGAGNDTLLGSAGSDVFLFKVSDLDGSVDDVKDFSLADGDVIELRDFVPDTVPVEDLSLYLQIVKAGTVGALVYDESGTGTNFVDVALIRNAGGMTIADLLDANALLY